MERKKENEASLQLRLPERKPGRREDALTDPQQTESWIHRLPLVNIGETARLVYQRVAQSNRLEMLPDQRLQIAELLTPSIEYVGRNLKRHYFDVSFPLPERQRKIAHLVRELFAELATAYKIVVADIVNLRGRRTDKKLLATAIQRAIGFQTQAFYQATLVYEAFEGSFWSDIHLLYALAEDRGIEKTAIKDSVHGGVKARVVDLYKQALLFSITSPFNHRQEEIERLYDHLEQWSRLVRVEAPGPASDHAGLFVDRLSSTEGPLHIDLQTKELSGRCRLVDVKGVLEWVQHQLKTMKPEESRRLPLGRRGLSRHTLEQLVDSLHSAAKRQFTRTRLNFELSTVIGLKSLHLALATTPDGPGAAGGGNSAERRYIPEDWLSGSVDNAALYAMNAEKAEAAKGDAKRGAKISRAAFRSDDAPSWAAQRFDEGAVRNIACKTVNESTGGYCIQWPAAYGHLVKVGELIGIQSPTDPKQYAAGVIRWIRNQEDGLQVGIETIARASRAALVRRANQEAGVERTEAGVILQGIHPAEDPASLVVPPYLFGVDETVWVASEHGEHAAELTELIEQTGAFCRFGFAYDEAGESDVLLDDEHAREFDGIWSTL